MTPGTTLPRRFCWSRSSHGGTGSRYWSIASLGAILGFNSAQPTMYAR
jgi:hypothetical protein